MAGMPLLANGSYDRELKVKGISDLEIGDWTQDSEVWASSGSSAASVSATSSHDQEPSLWATMALEMHTAVPN